MRQQALIRIDDSFQLFREFFQSFHVLPRPHLFLRVRQPAQSIAESCRLDFREEGHFSFFAGFHLEKRGVCGFRRVRHSLGVQVFLQRLALRLRMLIQAEHQGKFLFQQLQDLVQRRFHAFIIHRQIPHALKSNFFSRDTLSAPFCPYVGSTEEFEMRFRWYSTAPSA